MGPAEPPPGLNPLCLKGERGGGPPASGGWAYWAVASAEPQWVETDSPFLPSWFPGVDRGSSSVPGSQREWGFRD